MTSTASASYSNQAFFGVAALVFVASAAITIVWCASMAAMGGMPMPGGWTMSMAWMRMPGQSWLGAAAMFLGMWIAMMAAMMLPSLIPMLWRYRRSLATTGETRLDRPTVLAAAGYFFVWTGIGAVVFAVGVALSALAMQKPALARAVPIVAGAVVMIAGMLQFTPWKLRHLACCRTATNDAATHYRYGVRLGLHCVACCGGMIAILLVVGVMNLVAMAVVAVAITVERVLPAGERVARIMGAIIVATGLLLIASA